MSKDPLYVHFVYPSGDPEAYVERLTDGFHASDRFTTDRIRGVESALFEHCSPEDSPDAEEFWPGLELSEMRYPEDDGSVVDLYSTPVVMYGFHDLNFMISHEDRDALSALLYDRDEDRTTGVNQPFVEEIIEFAKVGYGATEQKPYVVHSEEPSAGMLGRPPYTAQSLADRRLTYLPWLTIFPPALVATYGREQLLSAPAWRVEELGDGAILVVVHDDLTWFRSGKLVGEHIGLPSIDTIPI